VQGPATTHAGGRPWHCPGDVSFSGMQKCKSWGVTEASTQISFFYYHFIINTFVNVIPAFILLLISNLIPLWPKNGFYSF
jgi:hypothetical protein